jgi:hypothetical protein
MKSVKIVVEKHPDGYVAYPIGHKGVVVGLYWRLSSPKRMPKFPVDAPKAKVVAALKLLGFRVVTEEGTYCDGPREFGRLANSSDHPESSQHQKLDSPEHLHAIENWPRGIFTGIQSNLSNRLVSPLARHP